MTNTDEKRRTIRYAIEAPINCSYFNLPVSASARAVNFSQDGMHFISEMEFCPGSAVVIQAINDSSLQETLENKESMRQTTIAESIGIPIEIQNPKRGDIPCI
jgi:hypothetical protein